MWIQGILSIYHHLQGLFRKDAPNYFYWVPLILMNCLELGKGNFLKAEYIIISGIYTTSS